MSQCAGTRRVCTLAWTSALMFPLVVSAQTGERTARPLIAETVNEARLHRLAGNTRPEATTLNDAGAVPEDLPMEHMMIQLQRSTAQERAASQFIDDLHNRKSPNYHKWLTAAQFGEAYGASQSDIGAVTAWLQSHGFTVNSVSTGGMLIDFSGTAGQVRSAFHTEVHHLNVNGQQHVANMSDPQIPEALAPAVAGIVSLHDFTPHAMKRARPNFTYGAQGSTYQAITPADLATLYNLAPAFAQGYTGQGQTIAVIEDSDLYNTADWNTFRATFGLSQYSNGSLSEVHPGCASPGANADDGEATLDAEWASAAAPNAAIQVASCANTRTTFGGFLALVNLINSANPPTVISISYGECEAGNGSASNAAFSAAYQQAVAEGISVFVSAGDEGAASCDAGTAGATHGIGVSAYASTPYNVAVGGTDLGDSYAGVNSQYWNTTNDANYGSAISYVPEIPWDDSCASGLLSSFLGFPSPYGANGLCTSATARQNGLLQVAAGSGGPSGCATGTPSASGVVGGTCQGYAKPSWQAGVAGIPGDGVRDIPDVSLFSGTGVWGHYYVMCWSDKRNGGASCAGDPSTWAGAGGTSFAAPILAGIQALVNQRVGSPQGNPNYMYYQLAALGSTVCDASTGDSATSACVFHNVTEGDDSVNCGGSLNCYGVTASTAGFGRGGRGGSSDNGALSTSAQSYASAFGASAGWNFATGIGSINVLNLVNAWFTAGQ